MTEAEHNIVVADTLVEIAGALNEGAAGPCDFWYKKLAERLIERAKKRKEEVRSWQGR